MSINRIHMTIKIEDLEPNGNATECGVTDEAAAKLRKFIDNMYSDYVTIELTEIAISEGDEWRITS